MKKHTITASSNFAANLLTANLLLVSILLLAINFTACINHAASSKFTAGSKYCVVEQFSLPRNVSFPDALTIRQRFVQRNLEIDHNFTAVSIFAAGRFFWPITKVKGVIEQFGLPLKAPFQHLLTILWRI